MTTTTETLSPVMTEQLVRKIEAAGFDSLAATGMTEPVLAKELGITQDELAAYRKYRSVPVDFETRNDWLIKQLRSMAADRETYFQLSISDIAAALGTTTLTVNKVMDFAGVETPYSARQKVIVGLLESGYDSDLIANIVGVSEKMVNSFDVPVIEDEPKRKMKPLSQYAPKRTGADSHTQRIMRFLYQNDRPEGWTRSEIIAAVGDLGVSPWRRISDVKEKGLAEAVTHYDGTPVMRLGESGHDQAVTLITEAGRIYCKEQGYDA
jgi:hypothetical protein